MQSANEAEIIDMKTYHYFDQGVQRGPVTEADIRSMLSAGTLNETSPLWTEGMAEWKPAAVVLLQAPPPIPGSISVSPPSAQIGDDFGMRLLLPVGRSGWAIAAGYLGLFGLVLVPAPLALIVSIIAIRDIRKSANSPHPKHGMGRAIFGLIVGVFGSLILIWLIVQGFMTHQAP